jgi:SAM-dependent methyltransferase
MAQRGARVTGMDFSIRSIEYARNVAKRDQIAMDFVHANYLEDDLPTDQDLVCLIYGDLCALSPAQRSLLFGKVKTALKPGGHFVFDVFSTSQFAQCKEVVTYGPRLLDGFWAEGDYFGFLNTFLYDDLKLALDRYLIIESERVREVFNWLQYFDPETLTEELTTSGFEVLHVVDALTGEPWNTSPREFAVVARIE